MGQIAGEHDEVGLFLQAVNRGDGLFQRHFRIGVGWAFEPPMAIGQLDKIEVLGGGTRAVGGGGGFAEAGGEYDAAEPGQFHEVTSVDFHALLLWLR